MRNSIKSLFVIIDKSIRCFPKDRGSFGISYKLQWKKQKNKYRNLEKYKDIYKGKKCFIVGTGPSLSLDDINKLKGSYSIGVNTLYKLYDKTDWRANFYCIIDPTTYASIGEEIKKYHSDTLFIAGNRIKEKDPQINKFSLECSSFYRVNYPQYFDTPCEFSGNLSNEIYDGASVVYAALQIAVYMGFKDIYLLGTDCNYNTDVNLHGKSMEYKDSYKYNWTKQTGLAMIECFKTAKKYSERNKINICNATRGGMLEVFPRVNLDDIVGDHKHD